MKICPTCESIAFEDMPICYGCLQPFDNMKHSPSPDWELPDLPDEFFVEEPLDELDDLASRPWL